MVISMAVRIYSFLFKLVCIKLIIEIIFRFVVMLFVWFIILFCCCSLFDESVLIGILFFLVLLNCFSCFGGYLWEWKIVYSMANRKIIVFR